MFRKVPLSIIRSFSLYTQQWYMLYSFADNLRAGSGRPDPIRKLSAHIPLLCVQWKTPDEGQRNCPKHVEFYSKNKFEKLVHLVGFIIRTNILCLMTLAHITDRALSRPDKELLTFTSTTTLKYSCPFATEIRSVSAEIVQGKSLRTRSLPTCFSVEGLWILSTLICFVFGATAPQWARASSFTSFLDHT